MYRHKNSVLANKTLQKNNQILDYSHVCVCRGLPGSQRVGVRWLFQQGGERRPPMCHFGGDAIGVRKWAIQSQGHQWFSARATGNTKQRTSSAVLRNNNRPSVSEPRAWGEVWSIREAQGSRRRRAGQTTAGSLNSTLSTTGNAGALWTGGKRALVHIVNHRRLTP